MGNFSYLQAQQIKSSPNLGPETGLPLPRFVALKFGEGNMRAKPSLDHEVLYVYLRAGLPLKVVEEEGTWRRVQDHEGIEGWMNRSLLTSTRGFRVMTPLANVYRRPNVQSLVKAELEQGVIGELVLCRQDGWCRVSLPEVSGWIEVKDLWGVLPGEIF